MPKAPDHPPVTARLPPPPAPVARDANPWPMPGRGGETRRARIATSPAADHPSAPTDPTRSSRHGLARFLPIAIFLAIVGSVVSGALEALGRGDRLGALIPLIVIAIAAVSVWRSRRRTRRQNSAGSWSAQQDR